MGELNLNRQSSCEENRIKLNIQEKVSLSDYTTFKIGGPADYFVKPGSPDEFVQSIEWALKKGLPFFILGKGSNILVSDEGYRGLVIYTERLNGIRAVNNGVEAECGALIDDVVDFSAERGLTGIEFLAGMPGTVGGAVYMNARAYGGEISGVFKRADVVALEDGKTTIKIFNKEDMNFSYKYSVLQKRRHYLLKALFELQISNPGDVKKRVEEIRRLRREKGEYIFPSAGCIFKNDYSLGVSAGKIIDSCGLKKTRIGEAEVYEKHANFIINRGGASSRDVYELIKLVEKKVKEKTGIKLEREIILLGFEN